MDSGFPGSRLEILPVCLSRNGIGDQDIQFLDEFSRERNCQCTLEIFHPQGQGPERLLHQDEQICYVTELPSDGSTNAIRLHFASPFYVDENLLLIPAARAGGFVLVPAGQYQIRFRFAMKQKWFPIDLDQLFGPDQPTDNSSKAPNSSLWARGYDALCSMASSQDSAASLYRIRMEYETQASQKLQSIVWDLRVRYWWTEPALSLTHSRESTVDDPELVESSNPYTSSSRASLVNLQVQTTAQPEPPIKRHMNTRSSARTRACEEEATRRRSKRLETKNGILKRTTRSCT